MKIAGGSLKWLGDEIAARAIEATTAAIDEVTHAAADDAKANHWWGSRSGNLERNTFAEPAAPTPEGTIRGRFGSSMRLDGFYGLFLERKTPWLRPAADRHFKTLPRILRGKTRWT